MSAEKQDKVTGVFSAKGNRITYRARLANPLLLVIRMVVMY